MADDQEARITLRLPTALRDRLAAIADASSRSMNGEIVSRLESSFQQNVALPETLAARVSTYANEHGRSLSEEVVRILEQKFPEPRSPDERFAELLAILADLQTGETSTVLEKFSVEVLRTLRDISSGGMDADPDTRRRVAAALETWGEAMLYKSYDAATSNMDPEELEKFERTGDDSIIVDPVFKEDEE